MTDADKKRLTKEIEASLTADQCKEPELLDEAVRDITAKLANWIDAKQAMKRAVMHWIKE